MSCRTLVLPATADFSFTFFSLFFFFLIFFSQPSPSRTKEEKADRDGPQRRRPPLPPPFSWSPGCPNRSRISRLSRPARDRPIPPRCSRRSSRESSSGWRRRPSQRTIKYLLWRFGREPVRRKPALDRGLWARWAGEGRFSGCFSAGRWCFRAVEGVWLGGAKSTGAAGCSWCGLDRLGGAMTDR